MDTKTLAPVTALHPAGSALADQAPVTPAPLTTEDIKRKLMDDAAHALSIINAGPMSGNAIVLRGSDFLDAQLAVDMALEGSDRSHGFTTSTVVLEAGYSIRGAHLSDLYQDHNPFADSLYDMVRAVVVVDAEFLISDLTLIPVTGQLRAEIRALVEAAGEAGTYCDSSDTIFIINEPPAGV